MFIILTSFSLSLLMMRNKVSSAGSSDSSYSNNQRVYLWLCSDVYDFGREFFLLSSAYSPCISPCPCFCIISALSAVCLHQEKSGGVCYLLLVFCWSSAQHLSMETIKTHHPLIKKVCFYLCYKLINPVSWLTSQLFNLRKRFSSSHQGLGKWYPSLVIAKETA